MTKSIFRFLALFTALGSIAACGGGSGGSFASEPPAAQGWQPGVFLDSSTFRNQCAAPRVGADATNSGRPFPDMQGTVLDENNFLRSFSDETYLWYSEIVDQNPAAFADPIDYFAELKTFARLPSGREKDPDSFHFAVDTLEWFNLYQGGVSAGYGAEFVALSTTVPREFLIAYTEPNSPASNHSPPLLRGSKILAIDGFDIDTTSAAGINALNNGLFPSSVGETHTFVVQDVALTPAL